MIRVGPALVDLSLREIRLGSEVVALSPQEAALLERLSASGGRPVERTVLLTEALGYREGIHTRALDHAITRLRRKLGDPSKLPSVYGVGYRLVFDAEDEDLVGRAALLAELRASEGDELPHAGSELRERQRLRAVPVCGLPAVAVCALEVRDALEAELGWEQDRVVGQRLDHDGLERRPGELQRRHGSFARRQLGDEHGVVGTETGQESEHRTSVRTAGVRGDVRFVLVTGAPPRA